eukprot:5049825-Alexandrium_andersonii.AAC.1
MSASLVGSEMCIRDRPDFVVARFPDYAGPPCFADLPKTWAPVPCVEVAVSYTHLTLPTICSV